MKIKKNEIIKLIKLVDRYKTENLSGKNPFGVQDAYWAAGLENFLTWLSHEKI